jgi:hypothetical protein
MQIRWSPKWRNPTFMAHSSESTRLPSGYLSNKGDNTRVTISLFYSALSDLVDSGNTSKSTRGLHSQNRVCSLPLLVITHPRGNILSSYTASTLTLPLSLLVPFGANPKRIMSSGVSTSKVNGFLSISSNPFKVLLSAPGSWFSCPTRI